MDQLRQVVGWLKRHHFWVLVVVATGVALGCWYRGATALYADFVRDKQTIQAEFSKQAQLLSEPFHANDAINKKQQDEIAKQRERVNELWKQLYDRQRADVLKWPSNLSDRFRRYVERLKFGDTIPENLRGHYNQYIDGHFPELPKIVGALEMSDSSQGSGRGGYEFRSMRGGGRGMRGMEMEGGLGGRDPNAPAAEEENYIVEWLDQQRIREELYMPTTPSSKRIWVTQEDLWVYEALLGITARTNQAKGADRFSNAAVRTIISLEVGRLAAQASRGRGRIEILAAAGAPGADMMGVGPEGMGMDRGGMEYDRGGPGGEMDYGPGVEMGGRGGEMGGDAMGDATLFTGRYLDDQGKPIMTEGAGGPEGLNDEFKRLPIRMVLDMDQRWLPHLIAECANAPLQVEVTEVRVNPPGGLEGGGGGGSSYGRRGGGDFYGSSSGQSGEPMVPEREPNIKSISIQGTIFIFNPPTETTSAQQLADVQ
jgi:hypothetical protein